MKIQDSTSLMEWNALKDAEIKAANLIVQLDKSNDTHIYKLAKQIGINKIRGEATGDLEKQLKEGVECQSGASNVTQNVNKKMDTQQ